jgi:hypothetical protein
MLVANKPHTQTACLSVTEEEEKAKQTGDKRQEGRSYAHMSQRAECTQFNHNRDSRENCLTTQSPLIFTIQSHRI